MNNQKFLIITGHINHPKFDELPDKHGFIVDEIAEIKNLLSLGWTVKSITPANLANSNTSYGYAFAVVLDKL